MVAAGEEQFKRKLTDITSLVRGLVIAFSISWSPDSNDWRGMLSTIAFVKCSR
jgi:hypothetical protein